MIKNLSSFTFYEADEQEGADTIVFSYGITSQASREAVQNLRTDGRKVSLLIAKTLLPVPPVYYEILSKYNHIVVAEENFTGLYRQLLFGAVPAKHITGINDFGKMINPASIIKEVKQLL